MALSSLLLALIVLIFTVLVFCTAEALAAWYLDRKLGMDKVNQPRDSSPDKSLVR